MPCNVGKSVCENSANMTTETRAQTIMQNVNMTAKNAMEPISVSSAPSCQINWRHGHALAVAITHTAQRTQTDPTKRSQPSDPWSVASVFRIRTPVSAPCRQIPVHRVRLESALPENLPRLVSATPKVPRVLLS